MEARIVTYKIDENQDEPLQIEITDNNITMSVKERGYIFTEEEKQRVHDQMMDALGDHEVAEEISDALNYIEVDAIVSPEKKYESLEIVAEPVLKKALILDNENGEFIDVVEDTSKMQEMMEKAYFEYLEKYNELYRLWHRSKNPRLSALTNAELMEEIERMDRSQPLGGKNRTELRKILSTLYDQQFAKMVQLFKDLYKIQYVIHHLTGRSAVFNYARFRHELEKHFPKHRIVGLFDENNVPPIRDDVLPRTKRVFVTTQRRSFDVIPPSIFDGIIVHRIGPRELGRMEQTGKALRNLIKQSDMWKILFERDFPELYRKMTFTTDSAIALFARPVQVRLNEATLPIYKLLYEYHEETTLFNTKREVFKTNQKENVFTTCSGDAFLVIDSGAQTCYLYNYNFVRLMDSSKILPPRLYENLRKLAGKIRLTLLSNDIFTLVIGPSIFECNMVTKMVLHSNLRMKYGVIPKVYPAFPNNNVIRIFPEVTGLGQKQSRKGSFLYANDLLIQKIDEGRSFVLFNKDLSPTGIAFNNVPTTYSNISFSMRFIVCQMIDNHLRVIPFRGEPYTPINITARNVIDTVISGHKCYMYAKDKLSVYDLKKRLLEHELPLDEKDVYMQILVIPIGIVLRANKKILLIQRTTQLLSNKIK